MSWSIRIVGKPNPIIDALEAESSRLTDQSKVEFDSVKEPLKRLVANNYGRPNAEQPTLELTASGHGYAEANGDQVERQVQVELKATWAKIAV